MSEEPEYELSCGNIFADLGFPEPDTALIKAELMGQIVVIVEQRGWTEAQAAEVIGVAQSEFLALTHGRLRDVSVERLMGFLTRLDHDVSISVVPNASPDRPARIAVHGAATQATRPSAGVRIG